MKVIAIVLLDQQQNIPPARYKGSAFQPAQTTPTVPRSAPVPVRYPLLSLERLAFVIQRSFARTTDQTEKQDAIALAQQEARTPSSSSAPVATSNGMPNAMADLSIKFSIVVTAGSQPTKRTPPARGSAKKTAAPRQKSTFAGWALKGCEPAMEVPWAPMHEAYEKVEATPPASQKGASPIFIQRGDVVQLKSDPSNNYSVYWLQSRNMEPTGWECAVSCARQSSIMPLSEIIGHKSGDPKDVAEAAAAYWKEMAAAYTARNEADAARKRKQADALHTATKRKKAARAAQRQVEMTPIPAPHVAVDIHKLEMEVSKLGDIVSEMRDHVSALKGVTDRLLETHSLYHVLLQGPIARFSPMAKQ